MSIDAYMLQIKNDNLKIFTHLLIKNDNKLVTWKQSYLKYNYIF